MNNRCLYRWAGAALMGLWCVLAQAQAPWPSKNIRIVVPYAAGGPADLVARELAQVLTADLKQSVVSRTWAAPWACLRSAPWPAPSLMATPC
jgi:tripartite-type tricarboxylate transporter receptor subunit TctC